MVHEAPRHHRCLAAGARGADTVHENHGGAAVGRWEVPSLQSDVSLARGEPHVLVLEAVVRRVVPLLLPLGAGHARGGEVGDAHIADGQRRRQPQHRKLGHSRQSRPVHANAPFEPSPAVRRHRRDGLVCRGRTGHCRPSPFSPWIIHHRVDQQQGSSALSLSQRGPMPYGAARLSYSQHSLPNPHPETLPQTWERGLTRTSAGCGSIGGSL